MADLLGCWDLVTLYNVTVLLHALTILKTGQATMALQPIYQMTAALEAILERYLCVQAAA